MKALLLALFASSITASGAMAAETQFDRGGRLRAAPGEEACARLATQTVAPDGVRLFKRLDQLPWAVLEHAVWRSVAGCPVREIRYQGQTWYVTSGRPQIERLEPAVPDTKQR